MKKIELTMILIALNFIGCGSIQGTIPTNNTPSQEDKIDYNSKFINTTDCNQIIDKEFFTSCFDYKLKATKSVSYTLEGDLMSNKIEKRPSFYKEPTLDKRYQIVTTDYTNTGYDRGHLAPHASFDWSQESLDAVYSLVNIIPQAPQVNRNMWVKVEKYARDKALTLGSLDVLNVVRYSKNHKTIGKNRMAVSKGFYKVLYNHDKNYQECFYYINRLNASSRDDTINKHRIDCDEVKY